MEGKENVQVCHLYVLLCSEFGADSARSRTCTKQLESTRLYIVPFHSFFFFVLSQTCHLFLFNSLISFADLKLNLILYSNVQNFDIYLLLYLFLIIYLAHVLFYITSVLSDLATFWGINLDLRI